MIKVVIESPFSSSNGYCVEENLAYLRAVMADCLARGEAPYASHALYTQPGVLDDNNPEEQEQGMEAGFEWGALADVRVVYTDMGMTSGMETGIARMPAEQALEYRTLEGWPIVS